MAIFFPSLTDLWRWQDQRCDDDDKDELCIRLYYHNGDGSGDAGSDCTRAADVALLCVISRAAGAEQGRPWRAVAASARAWGSGEEQMGGVERWEMGDGRG